MWPVDCVVCYDETKDILILHEFSSLDGQEGFLHSLISPSILTAHPHNLKALSHSYFKYLFCSVLSSPSGIPNMCTLYLGVCPTVIGYCVLFFCFQFLKISLLFNLRSFY